MAESSPGDHDDHYGSTIVTDSGSSSNQPSSSPMTKDPCMLVMHVLCNIVYVVIYNNYCNRCIFHGTLFSRISRKN